MKKVLIWLASLAFFGALIFGGSLYERVFPKAQPLADVPSGEFADAPLVTRASLKRCLENTVPSPDFEVYSSALYQCIHEDFWSFEHLLEE